MTDLLLLAAAMGAAGGRGPGGAALPPVDPPAAMATTRPTGRVVRGTFRNAAGERPYALHLPDRDVPAGGKGRALVVLLHGCTQDADDVARGTRLPARAGERGWMVLLPEQPASSHPRKCWTWYDPGHQGRGAGEPSILAGMIEEVVRTHGGDPGRVYLAGVSAGAAMASLVAAAYPELIAGLALHSGLVYAAAGSVGDALGAMQRGAASPEPHAERAHAAMGPRARVIPTLVLHGEADQVVAPINGAQAARQWFLTNALSRGQPLDTTSGATDHVQGEVGGYGVRRSTYRAKDGTPLAHLVLVRELGHAWSGGSAEGTFTSERGPDATMEVLDFFSRLPQRPAP